MLNFLSCPRLEHNMAGPVQHLGLLTPRLDVNSLDALFLKSALAQSPKSEITPCGSGKFRWEKEALSRSGVQV